MSPRRALPLPLPVLMLAVSLLAACSTTRTLANPTLEVRTPQGVELGVSTEYGVVFLGRTARSGPVDLTAWFGDGPSVEVTVIEPLGGGLYTAETEIRLPTVPMTFRTPVPGQEVTVRGRRGREDWEEIVKVVSDPRVTGILIQIPGQLRDAPDQIGAGVYVSEGEHEVLFVGLVSGRLRLIDADGRSADYLTVMGPDEMWRLVTFRREFQRKRNWVYREDIL